MDIKNLKVKLPAKALLDLSAIIDKMEIKDNLISIDKKTNQEVAEEVFKLIISNLHKAEKEFLNFIIDYKNLEEEIVIDNEEELSVEDYQKKYELKKIKNRLNNMM